MEPGRYRGISNEEYHKGPGISSSGLGMIASTPEEYFYSLTHPREETRAMAVGSAFHKLVLEPEGFDDEFFVMDDAQVCAEIGGAKPRATSKYKEWLEGFLSANAGKTLLEYGEYEGIKEMAKLIRRRKAFKAISAPGRAEDSFFWRDPELGVLCKCRPDYLRDDNYIIDLKTTEDASPAGFTRSVENYRYYVQAAFYIQGVEAVTGEPVKGFVFVAVEKKPPYLVACYAADDDMIQAGNEEVRRCLELYEECSRTGVWPGYPDEILPLSRPRWATTTA
ncbi:MAG: PD-(D/E)XK nuclease-like domain-containing protein [Synergistaceae bacterium]|jgi:exodeoxyribonuclease VIII|nr:PD-(D/E)XK nuclease-like domain-containing protein [Synergistaceae bacterium]